MNATITRKEIAEAAGISVDTVKRNETVWGLNRHRSKACKKPVVYFRRRAMNLLASLGIVADVN
jgi:hypothetical protein